MVAEVRARLPLPEGEDRGRDAARSTIVAAVPQLGTYQARTGIGRVLYSLREQWGEHVRLVEAAFQASRLPLLRNVPRRVHVPAEAQLVLLPQLTGAQALRHTGGRPSIAAVHDIGIVDFPGDRQYLDWPTRFSLMYSFRGLSHASHVIAVSNFSRERLIRHMPQIADRVSVVPNGVSPTFLNHGRPPSEARRRVEIHLGRPLRAGPILLNVGTETPRKNMPLLLAVFARIKAHHPSAQLLKVGRPGHPRWRTRTQAVASQLGLAIGEDIVILEDIDDDLLADVYSAANLFLSTSVYEGFGLPALEAMAVGTPVVVTNRGALPEVVGEVGWTVEPDIEAFVQAVMLALADPWRNDRVHRGRTRAAGFAWSQTAASYRQIMVEMRHHVTPRTGGGR